MADDFVTKAKRFYPPREDGDDTDEEGAGLAINLPLLLARIEAKNAAGDDDDEEEELEDES